MNETFPPTSSHGAGVIIGALSSDEDGTQVVARADPTTHRILVDSNATISGTAVPISGASTAVGVAIVDGSGNQITSFGGGTQYTEGDTDATITGTAALVEGAANALAVMTQPLTDTQIRATALPVSGTVTANLSATDSAVLDAIEADTTVIAGAVSAAHMQVDVLTVPTVTVNAHAVTNAGTFATQVDGAALTALQLIDNMISGSEAQVDIVAAIPAGTNAIGNVGIVPRTTGGATIFRSIDIDETEEEIKATAGQVFGYYMFNATAATVFVKFYNATAANVTVGTTTPVLTLPIPAGAAANSPYDFGIAFGTAITVAATTGVADNDTTGPAANGCVINVFYA